MKTSRQIILIDDDTRNNYLCCQVLKKLCSPVSADIRSFSFVEKGLQHIENTLRQPDSQVVLFLDINMPLQLSGWEVLDHLSRLPESMQSRLTVFMLSSSTRTLEKAKAIGYRLVKQFIQKPLLPSMTWLRAEILVEHTEKPITTVQSDKEVANFFNLRQTASLTSAFDEVRLIFQT